RASQFSNARWRSWKVSPRSARCHASTNRREASSSIASATVTFKPGDRPDGVGDSRARKGRGPADFCSLFEVIRGPEQRAFGEWPAEKFETEREALARKPARHGEGRIAKDRRQVAVVALGGARQSRRCMVERRMDQGVEPVIRHDFEDRRTQRFLRL